MEQLPKDMEPWMLNMTHLLMNITSFPRTCNPGCYPQQAAEAAVLRTLFNGWMLRPPGAHCSWQGVTCSAATGRVVRLDLSNRGLTGQIPPLLAAHVPESVSLDTSIDTACTIDHFFRKIEYQAYIAGIVEGTKPPAVLLRHASTPWIHPITKSA